MLEIDGDLVADHRLHLPQPPIGLFGMSHQVAGFEKFVHRGLRVRSETDVSAPRIDAHDLSALVAARLCHDLISPMGAIGNGMELLQMTEGRGAAELELISDSLATALAKLRFYRLAFGPADAQARQSIDEARQITDAMFHGRFTVAWDARGAGMRRTTARLVYLAILCLEKSLPMGGSARVLIEDEAVGLAVEGCRVAPHSNLWLHVTHGVPVLDLGSGGVQFALLRQGLEASGHRIEVDFGETDVTVRMTAPSPILA